MAGNQKWTAQDDEDLVHLTQAGYCAETVAQVLGRSASAIQKRLAQIRHAEWDALAADAAPVLTGEQGTGEPPIGAPSEG